MSEISKHLPLTRKDTEDYAEIYDRNGEKVALTVRPELIMSLNTLSSLPAIGEGSRVEVKPLEWHIPAWSINLNRAETIAGAYAVWTHAEARGRWFWRLEGLLSTDGECASEDEAKAAAQADYERRILSALRSPPERNEYGNLAENAEYISVLKSRIEMLSASPPDAELVRMLTEALKPFAEIAPLVETTDRRDGERVHEQRRPDGTYFVLTRDDFRRARAAFSAKETDRG